MKTKTQTCIIVSEGSLHGCQRNTPEDLSQTMRSIPCPAESSFKGTESLHRRPKSGNQLDTIIRENPPRRMRSSDDVEVVLRTEAEPFLVRLEQRRQRRHIPPVQLCHRLRRCFAWGVSTRYFIVVPNKVVPKSSQTSVSSSQ